MKAFAPRHRRGLVLLLCAIGLFLAARVVVDPSAAAVHVRWQPSIDAQTRRQREAVLHLADGQQLDEHTWRYTLADTSPDNVRAIVLDEGVADTHYIDRTTYAIDSTAPRFSRQRFGAIAATMVRIVNWSAVLLALFGALVLLGHAPKSRDVAQFGWRTFAAFQGVTRIIQRLLLPLIPELDRRALGAFRIAVGAGLVWAISYMDFSPIAPSRQVHRAALDLPIVHTIAASTNGAATVQNFALLAALVFTIGAWSRLAYGLVTAAFLLLTLLSLEASSAHDLGLPFVTMLGWLMVPWGASALSVDDWRRRRARAVVTEGPGTAYGFAIWWPGLTLGVALLAAAYAKLAVSGLAWITAGAVKYHFVTDAGAAPTNLGLWIASRDWAAVLASAGAILGEALFIFNIFVTTPGRRFIVGLAGAIFFLGLYLVQGIYWPAWLMLFLAFLPWAWMNDTSARTSDEIATTPPAVLPARPLAFTQVGVVVLLISVQIYASFARTEAEPFLSNFPMYSHSYLSTAHFDYANRAKLTRMLVVRADNSEVTGPFRDLPDNDRTLLMDMAEQPTGAAHEVGEDDLRRQALVCANYQRLVGRLPTSITFEMERRHFDWHQGVFGEYQRVPATPVHLAALCEQVVTTAAGEDK